MIGNSGFTFITLLLYRKKNEKMNNRKWLESVLLLTLLIVKAI